MKTLKLRDTGLCAGNSPATDEFPAQMASNTEMIHLMTSSWYKLVAKKLLGMEDMDYVTHPCHEHAMTRKRFPHYWPFVRGIHRPSVDSFHKGASEGGTISHTRIATNISLQLENCPNGLFWLGTEAMRFWTALGIRKD